MLFNSEVFIFVFLPATFAIYFALSRLSRYWAMRWIIVASLIFYAWWRPVNVLIIVPAIIVNFAIAKAIIRYRDEGNEGRSRAAMIAGIVFNIAFLGYFKYVNFVLTASNDLFDSNFTLVHIVLPLGISFITFQMIAFLIDVQTRRVESASFLDYCSFILFFPQLIAGPIVHFREMMPQFQDTSRKDHRENLSVGLTLFIFGLFKKVVIADGMAPMVSSIYATADAGSPVSLLPAWAAAVGFTFQIYFDFSGYTDMAMGAARTFGIRLPTNFRSPLRSSSIIDFWLNWHVSLTRFLTAYVYNPITLALTRRRILRGLPGLGGRENSVAAFAQLLIFPTIFTMFISGLWHGAAYVFVVWGLLHGIYLCINHAWRLFARSRWGASERYDRIMRPVGLVLTFVCVAFSMVIFRSSSLASAGNIIQGMLGLNGIEIPTWLYTRVAEVWAGIANTGLGDGLVNGGNVKLLAVWIVVLTPLVFLAPNTLQLMREHKPAVDSSPDQGSNFLFGTSLTWRATPAWAVVTALMAWLAVRNVGGYSEFLYWQF